MEAGAGGEPDPHTLRVALGTREPRGAVNKVFTLFHPEVWLRTKEYSWKSRPEAWKEEPGGLKVESVREV